MKLSRFIKYLLMFTVDYKLTFFKNSYHSNTRKDGKILKLILYSTSKRSKPLKVRLNMLLNC